MKYLSDILVRDSFLRLRQQEKGGKWGIERTSALMCFLAFDAYLKRTGINPPLDLDPDQSYGKVNREGISREFVRLVHVKNVDGKPLHVVNLGTVCVTGSSPENRFSANFLTVPVKAATTSSEPYEYPSRPKNPLIILGSKATGYTWGMDRHRDWRNNLPVFLQGRDSKTPFHDLACFLLRQRAIETEEESIQGVLGDGLAEVFTTELCDYLKLRIGQEKMWFRHADGAVQDTPNNPFEDHSWALDGDNGDVAAALVARVEYLENLLRMHSIAFEE